MPGYEEEGASRRVTLTMVPAVPHRELGQPRRHLLQGRQEAPWEPKCMDDPGRHEEEGASGSSAVDLDRPRWRTHLHIWAKI